MKGTGKFKQEPAKDPFCELWVYEGIPLSVMMLQG